MNHRFKRTLLTACLSTLLATQAVIALADTECGLGSTCRLAKGDKVYYTVTPKTGTAYECTVSAEPAGACYDLYNEGDYRMSLQVKGSVFCGYSSYFKFHGDFADPKNSNQMGRVVFENYKQYEGGDANITCKVCQKDCGGTVMQV